MLSEEAITEFKSIWKEVYKEELTDDEARMKASQFIKLFYTVYKPVNE